MAKFRITVDRDTDGSEGPRDWDNLGTFVGWHRDYRIGDEQPSEEPHEYRKALPDDEIVLSVYMYEHGGVAYSTTEFGDAWDSGQVGFIHANLSDPKAEGMTADRIRECLAAEIETYSQWASGDVWGYTVEEWKPSDCGDPEHGEWEHFDSCWGFYGSDWRENGMREHVPDEISDDELQAAFDTV
jgi:hypothetical protein